MIKPVVLCDMDGVVVDLVKSWLRAYEWAGGEHLEPSDIFTYDFKAIVRDPALFHAQLHGRAILATSEPLGDISGFKEMCARFDVFIVTYVGKDCGYGFSDKLYWLGKYFPWFDKERVIFTKHKELVRGDVLIEDNPEMLDRWGTRNAGRRICVNAAYNVYWEPSDIYNEVRRVNDITEALAALKEIYPDA